MASRFETGSARELWKDGVWFRDGEGRYALFRGVNLAGRSKRPPYLPLLPVDVRDLDTSAIERFHSELATLQPEFDRMKELGFTAVRLIVIWKAIEPSPNPNPDQLLPEGQIYMSLIKKVADALYARGIFCFIDFHQDIAHEIYGGDGFPDWALGIDEDHERPNPPSDLHATNWGLHYYDTPYTAWDVLVRNTLASFWRNRLWNTTLSERDLVLNGAEHPQTHLLKTVGAVARFFQHVHDGRGHPGIIGYEPFNEPHPVGLGKHAFEEQFLPDFYRRALVEIRREGPNNEPGDPRSFIFVEPRVDWTTYPADGPEFNALGFTLAPETFLDTPHFADERFVFSFHHYDPWTVTFHSDNMHNKAKEWPDVYRGLREAATSRGLIPFLTEFGGSQDWDSIDTDLRPDIYHRKEIRAYMDLAYQQVEAKLLNATYWLHDFYNDTLEKDNWNLENFSLLGPNRIARHHDIVARPYPLRSSAEPTLVAFDIGTKHGAIILHGEPVDATTLVYVPAAFHYPNGFEVRATSSALVWDEGNQILGWLPDRQADTNQLVLCPKDAFDPTLLPQEAQDLLPRTPLQDVAPLPSVEISAVNYDPVGIDLPNEYATIRNGGGGPISLDGWTLEDVLSHKRSKPFVYVFPPFTLAPGAEVRVWTRAGANSEHDLFWGRNQAVWNNTGDTALLRNRDGVEVTRLSFPAYADAPPPLPKTFVVDTTIDIPESAGDVDSEVDLEPDDDFQLDGGGSIWAGVWGTGRNGPKGWNNVDHDPKFPLRNSNPYSLIGKFGTAGQYFYVGEQLARQRFGGAERQRLFLRTNDDKPGNGDGKFTCRVSVWR